MPTNMFQERILQRTLEQISDIPVPQVVEELVVVFTDLSQERDQQRLVGQIIGTAAISLNEIKDVPKFKRERDHQGPCITQQVVNKRNVHHLVSTVNAERPGSSRTLCWMENLRSVRSPCVSVRQFLLPTLRCTTSHHCTAALNPCASTNRCCTSTVSLAPAPNQPYG